jgi:predicted dehydrogenase
MVRMTTFFRENIDILYVTIPHDSHIELTILHASFLYTSNVEATISGRKERINLDPLWFMTESYSLTHGTLVEGAQKTKFEKPTLGKGYTYEIAECHACLRANKTESELWSHQNSLELSAIVEEVKNQIGLVYL